MKAKLPRLGLYFLGVLAALTLTVALAVVILRPPMADMLYLVALLTVTSLVSAAIGFASHRFGWWHQLPSLNQTLTLGYVVAVGLVFFNVWLTARLMFISEHDLAMGTLLLLFAGGVSVAFGYFLSSSITGNLQDLVRGAKQLSEGDYSARVEVSGNDEIAQLAQAFNSMVERLKKAHEAERSLEAARRNLVAWVSHDLRTPLASLRAMLDALADGVVNEPETVSRYLEQSRNEIERMNALINDLFELAQLDAGYLELHGEPSSLSDLISDTLEAFRARAEAKELSLSGRAEPAVDPVWMAPEKIGRVLSNLLENALDHTPPGGEIRLEARHEAGRVVVTVADTGEGIQKEHLPHVFERFYRVEKSRARNGATTGGAGLGLSIAKGLIEAHRGEIWVESSPDTGTTIGFVLPKNRP